MLVSQKINVNFNLPPEIHREFERMVSDFGGKQKWAAITAGILLLMEDEKLRKSLVQQVVGAEVDNSYDRLIDRAKSGAIRGEAGAGDADRRMKLAAKSLGKQRGKP